MVVQGERRAARELCRAAADQRAIKANGFVAQVKLTTFTLRLPPMKIIFIIFSLPLVI